MVWIKNDQFPGVPDSLVSVLYYQVSPGQLQGAEKLIKTVVTRDCFW